MNSLERYIRTIKKEPVDFLPRIPILMAFATHHIGSNYSQFVQNYEVLVRANEACVRDFGMDQWSTISDPFRETSGFGAELVFPEDAVPRCVKPTLEDDQDFTRLQPPDPYKSPRMYDRIQAVREMRRRVKDEYSVMGWVEGPAAEGADLRGVTNFLTDLLVQPDYANELMAFCIDTAIHFALAQLKEGADTIGIGDAIASQVSPQLYYDLIFPHEYRLMKAIKDAGGYVRLHICGNTRHLLPYWKELPCDVYDLDWFVPLKEARDVLGQDAVIATNLDPVREVMDSTPEVISQKLKQMYKEVGYPLMIGAGCEIPSGTPNENLKALCTPIEF
ncbi:MAG TPA: uroporphyrinogen decarboxylase family protein [Candidatus Hydrogenedens sp.]|nr:uroporphyrinogen decarboxylase family protein [Candidatus Hydrogenedens sp.]HPP59882.1 uroporphyrinogen decarboxylase family protein [Candidatus Hydrogenedens sp.]